MADERTVRDGVIPSTLDTSDDAAAGRITLSDSPALDEFHRSIRDALRPAARAALRGGVDAKPDASSLRQLDPVCAQARRNGMRVEQLLVLLKDAWWRLPEFRDAVRMDANVALSCVITHCIKEFYRPTEQS